LISLDITHDGVSNLRRAVVDLMDQTPTTIDRDEADPVRDRLASMLKDLDWVEQVQVRLREQGQVYFGEAFVVPSDETNIAEKIDDALERAHDLDWRIYAGPQTTRPTRTGVLDYGQLDDRSIQASTRSGDPRAPARRKLFAVRPRRYSPARR
jgi:hypothetical protein